MRRLELISTPDPFQGLDPQVHSLRLHSAVEQVATYLKEELGQGTWTGEMPGVGALARELGVNHKTVEAALGRLVKEGALVEQGPRRRRRIDLSVQSGSTRPLRIAILLFERSDSRVDYIVEIQHELNEAGHSPFYPQKTLEDLGMEVKQVASFVKRTPADAWLVVAGSVAVLEWFGAQPVPAFGLFGRWGTAKIAGVGPKKQDAYAAVVRKLVGYGHRRIVLLARPQRRLPQPGAPERAFLAALEKEGIAVSEYHFPHWENTKADFYRRLESLFKITPPTALVVQEAVLFSAVEQFLARRGLRVPEDVSLVCADPDPTFRWREPSIAHLRLDSAVWCRHILRWAAKVSRGETYVRQLSSHAEFVDGGTIGPAPK
jgi:DNA-binding LacI/PurR family transcriptional regulator/DNA-binding MarR family transcriptional regulator